MAFMSRDLSAKQAMAILSSGQYHTQSGDTGWRSGTLDARTPDHLRIEFDDSATIASCPTSVPMGLAASEIVSASHRPSDAARARLGAIWRD